MRRPRYYPPVTRSVLDRYAVKHPVTFPDILAEREAQRRKRELERLNNGEDDEVMEAA